MTTASRCQSWHGEPSRTSSSLPGGPAASALFVGARTVRAAPGSLSWLWIAGTSYTAALLTQRLHRGHSGTSNQAQWQGVAGAKGLGRLCAPVRARACHGPPVGSGHAVRLHTLTEKSARLSTITEVAEQGMGRQHTHDPSGTSGAMVAVCMLRTSSSPLRYVTRPGRTQTTSWRELKPCKTRAYTLLESGANTAWCCTDKATTA